MGHIHRISEVEKLLEKEEKSSVQTLVVSLELESAVRKINLLRKFEYHEKLFLNPSTRCVLNCTDVCNRLGKFAKAEECR